MYVVGNDNTGKYVENEVSRKAGASEETGSNRVLSLLSCFVRGT